MTVSLRDSQPTVGDVFLNRSEPNLRARLDFPTPELPSRTIFTLRVRTGLLTERLCCRAPSAALSWGSPIREAGDGSRSRREAVLIQQQQRLLVLCRLHLENESKIKVECLRRNQRVHFLLQLSLTTDQLAGGQSSGSDAPPDVGTISFEVQKGSLSFSRLHAAAAL